MSSSLLNRPVKLIGARRVVIALIIIDQTIPFTPCRSAKQTCSNEYSRTFFQCPGGCLGRRSQSLLIKVLACRVYKALIYPDIVPSHYNARDMQRETYNKARRVIAIKKWMAVRWLGIKCQKKTALGTQRESCGTKIFARPHTTVMIFGIFSRAAYIAQVGRGRNKRFRY